MYFRLTQNANSVSSGFHLSNKGKEDPSSMDFIVEREGLYRICWK